MVTTVTMFVGAVVLYETPSPSSRPSRVNFSRVQGALFKGHLAGELSADSGAKPRPPRRAQSAFDA